jgi:hypothetical protein
MDLHVDILRESNLRAVNSLNYLLSLRSGQASGVTGMSLSEVISSPVTTVYLARDGRQDIGMLTLVAVQLPDVFKAWVENLVIDDAEDWRRETVAEALLSAAVQACRLARVEVFQVGPGGPLDPVVERVCGKFGFERTDGICYVAPAS